MRLTARIGLPGIALAATVLMLAGCGGGSDRTTGRLYTVEHFRCETIAIQHQLRALEAGIAATRSEFEASVPGPGRAPILRSMKENVALIHRGLPSLERCPEQALPISQGKTVPEPAAPPAPQTIAVAHRFGPPRIEPGEQAHPASPCEAYGKNGVTTVSIYPETSGCARVVRGERLRVANLTGIGRAVDAVSVRVWVGDYEMWLGPGQEGVIPAPVETYYGRGTHSVGVIGGIGPTVLLLPEHCSVGRSVTSGEEPCFR